MSPASAETMATGGLSGRPAGISRVPPTPARPNRTRHPDPACTPVTAEPVPVRDDENFTERAVVLVVQDSAPSAPDDAGSLLMDHGEDAGIAWYRRDGGEYLVQDLGHDRRCGAPPDAPHSRLVDQVGRGHLAD